MPEGDDPDLAKLRQRRKQRDRVEGAVRAAVAALDFETATGRLREAGVGFTEVLPIERVLEVPQARQPGKLRHFDYRGYEFDVPEFPGESEVSPGLPPPELGEHTMELLAALGFDESQRAILAGEGAVGVATADAFAWAPVRDRAEASS
jgi:crotonobetainyl-CoA:carnitine CoA-transferase CaiB-like acyl-CoA transferase